MNNNHLLADVDVSYSSGRCKDGRRKNYIRPKKYCSNKGRSVSGFSDEEIDKAIIKAVRKWYYPMQYFIIEGKTIGSNSEQNAFIEYWRICEREDIGKMFPVQLILR